MNNKKTLSPKRIILLIVCAAMAALLLSTWVEAKTEIMGREAFSLWNVSPFVKALPDLNQWLGVMDVQQAELWEMGICIGIYVLLAFLCFELILCIWSLCSVERRIRRGGFISPALFAACAIAVPYVLDKYFGLDIAGAICLTVIPYITVAVGSIGLLLSLILKERDEDKDEDKGETKREQPLAVEPQTLPEPGDASTEKPAVELNVPYKTLGKLRLFSVYYYDPRANLRPITAGLDWARAMLQIRVFSYSSLSITAVRVDVEMVTAFKEIIKVESLPYTELLKREDSHGREYTSEFARLNVEPDVLRQVHEIRVYLRTVVCDGTAYGIPGNVSYKKSGIKPQELTALRTAYGKDVMERAEISGKGWICWCGRENGYFDRRCRMCGRSEVGKTQGSEAEPVFCGSCGAKLEGNVDFCYSCGAPCHNGGSNKKT